MTTVFAPVRVIVVLPWCMSGESERVFCFSFLVGERKLLCCVQLNNYLQSS